MSKEYNPETNVQAEIERLELEMKKVMQRRENVTSRDEKNVVNEHIDKLNRQLTALQAKLPR